MSTSGSSRAPRALRIPAYVAMLACAVGALAIVPFGGHDAGATTPAACHTEAAPLGPATGWTEFIRDDAHRGGSETEGTGAYGGDLTGTGARNVGIQLPGTTPPTLPTLVVKGSLSGTVNLNKGSAYVASGGTVNFNGGAGAGYLPSTSIDFDAGFTQLQGISTDWAAAPTTGSHSITGDSVNAYRELVGADADLNVFHLTQSDFPAGNGGVRIKTPVGSMTIINVAGSTVDLPANPQKIELWINGSWQQASASAASDAVVRGLVWNFPTATAVSIRNGGPFAGTVLAPNAARRGRRTAGAHDRPDDREVLRVRPRDPPPVLPGATGCVPGTPPPPGDSDVRITKSASTANPHGGDLVTYTLLVENVGDSPATGVVVEDVLPAGVTFDSATAPCTQRPGP